jgi:hypothetical protein
MWSGPERDPPATPGDPPRTNDIDIDEQRKIIHGPLRGRIRYLTNTEAPQVDETESGDL